MGLDAGDAIDVGRFELSVVWPDAFREEGGNADSLCLLARLDSDRDEMADWSALLVGDAEAPELEAMMDEGRVGQVDVYKVGHHGSAAALTDELARRLSPKVSLVSVGENNRYGHPSSDVVGWLEAAESSVVRTDESGDVAVRFFSDRMEVRTLR